MLLRPGARAGVELFMLRRSARSTFVPDAVVFPGGAVDPADYTGEALDETALREQFRAQVPKELPTDRSPVTLPDAAALVRAALRELHEEAGVVLTSDALQLFSHWVTPPGESRRYDTHFFVAAAAPGQHAQADAYETHDGLWIAPREALARERAGTMYLVYPTIKHLERLVPYQSVASVLDFARVKPILTIMPNDSPANGFTMPEPLENAW